MGVVSSCPARSALALLSILLVSVVLASSLPQRQDGLRNFLKPGGDYLTFESGRYGARLVDADRPALTVGRELFFRDWLRSDDTLVPRAGPYFDAASCAACHSETRTGTRGEAPRIARPAMRHDRLRLGPQLTTRHHGGRPPRSTHRVRWTTMHFTYENGDRRELRRPIATAVTRDGDTVPAALRSAPMLFGWGLLAQVPSDTLSAFEDARDRDSDGISGRLAGDDDGLRFLGWKNTEGSLHDQVAAALLNDMGVVAGADPSSEIAAQELDALVDYVAHLGVPAQRPLKERQRGDLLFGNVGCAACHVPALVTLKVAGQSFSEQLIWPYSDLLLHDMGDALADPGDAPDAAEWRTAPLWGVGLAEERLPNRGFLHDGRAATIEEAILWHGGEARAARDRFAALASRDRNLLLRFVRSL